MEEEKHEATFEAYVMLLRWGPKAHVDPRRPRLKITQISRLLKISREKVRGILKRCEAGGP